MIKVLLLCLVVFGSVCFANAQPPSEATVKKYNEISRLSSISERRKFLGEQTPENVVALWNLHFDRLLNQNKFSKEQIDSIEKVRSALTVDYVKAARRKVDKNTALDNYNAARRGASKLFNAQQIRDLFAVPGEPIKDK